MWPLRHSSSSRPRRALRPMTDMGHMSQRKSFLATCSCLSDSHSDEKARLHSNLFFSAGTRHRTGALNWIRNLVNSLRPTDLTPWQKVSVFFMTLSRILQVSKAPRCSSLIAQSNLSLPFSGEDLADVIQRNISDPSKTRRQVIMRLMFLGKVASAKNLKMMT